MNIFFLPRMFNQVQFFIFGDLYVILYNVESRITLIVNGTSSRYVYLHKIV